MVVPKVTAYMTPNPHSIDLRHSLAEAYAKMRRLNLKHLPVVAGNRLVGLVVDPDLKMIELLKGLDLTTVTVASAMTPVPYCVTESTPLDQVTREMSAQKYEVAVVMKDASVVGIFTATDALRALADVLQVRAAQRSSS